MIISLLAVIYVTLQNSWVQTEITNKIASRLSEHLNATIEVGKVDFGFFNKLYLEDVLIEDQNADTLLYSKIITARFDTIQFRKRHYSINELFFENNKLNIKRDSTNTFNFSFILKAIGDRSKNDSQKAWQLNCNQFNFNDLNIDYKNIESGKEQVMALKDLNVDISDFHSSSDSLAFSLNYLNLNNGKNLQIKNTSALVSVNKGKVLLQELNIESAQSEIKRSQIDLQFYEEKDSMNAPFDLNFSIGESQINLTELGELIPSIKGMNGTTELSGLIYGNMNDLKGKNLRLKLGDDTRATIDFYINELLNQENMYLFFDLKHSETTFSDISNFRLPNAAKRRYINFPESFYEAGTIKFNGNFSGFLSDFVTYGTLESEMGSLSTDILVTPEQNGLTFYSGNISTTDFELGQFLQNKTLDKLTFNVTADGNYNKKAGSVSGTFKGNIEEIDVNKYAFRNINFNGDLSDKMFDGILSINDPNLQFTFVGELDMNTVIPSFDFNLDLIKALPNKLNLGKNFPDAEIAFHMNANFKGNKIDNLDGTIMVEKGFYRNRNGQLNLEGIELKSFPQDSTNFLQFTSGFFDLAIDGKYHFQTITNAFKTVVKHYIPSFQFKNYQPDFKNAFGYKINVKEINPLAELFFPGLELETPFLLNGSIDSPHNNFEITGNIPSIEYNNFRARRIFINNKNTSQSVYSSKFKIGELFNRNGMKLYNISFQSIVSENVVDNIISWSNFDEITYSGNIKTQTIFSNPDSTKHQRIQINGLPSHIYVADTLWSIAPFVATIDSSTLEVENFSLAHGNQHILADGKIIKGKTDLLDFSLKNIDLSYLDKYFNRNLFLAGKVNGTFALANSIRKPFFLSDLNISELYFKNQFMGDISLLSKWNNQEARIDSELKVIRNNRQNLKAVGYLKPTTRELYYNTEVDSFSLIVLEAFMKKNFSKLQGNASGNVKVSGLLSDIMFDGALFTKDAGLTVNVTQIPYSFSDSVYFSQDTISFKNIQAYDTDNNSGIFNGWLTHDNFRNMNFDLSFRSNKIQALNTTSRDNEQFYGYALANGRLDITGNIASAKLTGSATSLPGTDIKISMESESTVDTYDFIEFVSEEEELEEKDDYFEKAAKQNRGEYDLSLTIEATPEAKVQLIYNSQIGDIIKAQGEGILLFEMNEKGDMSLAGNYNPTKGDYLFTLQNVINKRFTIEQGGSMVWSGDPYNANIQLNAIYKIKASLYDLVGDRYENMNQNQRIQVECIIKLTDELMNPTIGFDIRFPNIDEGLRDDLSQFFSTDEDMNKQILSLIVMGKFYTPEYMRGNFEAQNSNMLGTTASELFSNQLSNWLSQISSNWDVGFNYRPGNQITDDEIEVALSTQIFNDRVTLNGNIGNNSNQYSSTNNNSSQIVGDFDISVKLVPSGKIQFKAYNRSNNNLIYETAPYTQGIGLSFKEEYNSLDELIKKLGSIFKKKQKE